MYALAHERTDAELTFSSANVLGTATSSSSHTARSLSDLAVHGAKEQKFIVLIWRICRIHGCGRSGAESSRGRAVLNVASSAVVIFQTIRRLSLPSLEIGTITIQLLFNHSYKANCGYKAGNERLLQKNLRNELVVAPT
jgi:hypothetical protein